MKSFVVDTEIQAPPDRVFQIASDIPGSTRWQPSIRRIEMLTEGELGVGSRWKETRVEGKKEVTLELYLTQFDAPEAYTVVSEAMGVRFTTVVAVEPSPAGTRAYMTCYIEAKGFLAGVMAGMAEGGIKKGLAADLAALKKAAERS